MEPLIVEDLAVQATTLRAPATEGPPRVAVELANTADHEIIVSGGGSLPFSNYWSEDGALLLVPDDREYVRRKDGGGGGFVPESRTNGCWQSEATVVSESIGIEAILDGGESISNDFTVLTAGNCPPAGTYTFENEIGVSDGRDRATDLGELVVELALERNADGDLTGSSATVRPLQ